MSFNDFNLRVCKLLTCDPVLLVFFVCFPVQFYTAHAVHYGLLSEFATGKIEPRVGFASSVCIPVGRPYSTCPRISFSHSFLQVLMSLLHRRTHANCQTRTQQTQPNPWIFCETPKRPWQYSLMSWSFTEVYIKLRDWVVLYTQCKHEKCTAI